MSLWTKLVHLFKSSEEEKLAEEKFKEAISKAEDGTSELARARVKLERSRKRLNARIDHLKGSKGGQENEAREGEVKIHERSTPVGPR